MASFANEDPTAQYQGAGIELTPSGALVVPGGITNNPAAPPTPSNPSLQDVVIHGNISSLDIEAPYFRGSGKYLTDVASTLQQVTDLGNTTNNYVFLNGGLYSNLFQVPLNPSESDPLAIQNGDLVYNKDGTLAGALKIDYDFVNDVTTFDGNIIFNGETQILNVTNIAIDGPILWLGSNVNTATDSGVVFDRSNTGVSNVAAIYDGGEGVYKIMYTLNNRSNAHIVWDKSNLLPVKIYGSVEATNGFIGDATGLSNITSSAPGYYGDSRQVSQVYVDSNGRITFSNVGIDLNAVVSTSNVIQTQLQLLGGFTTGNVTATNNTLSAQFINGDGRGLTNVFTTSNLHQVSENGNVTTNVVQFVNGFVTHVGHVGISNVNPVHQLDIGETFFVQDGDVSAVNYFGNAAGLINTTDVSDGPYGSSSSVPVLTFLDGRLSSVEPVDIAITSSQVTDLSSAVVANITGKVPFSNVTGANLQTVTTGFQNNVTRNQLDLQRGLLVSNTNSSNIVLQVTGNVSAGYYFGNASAMVSLTGITPDTTWGSESSVPVVYIDQTGKLSSIENVDIRIDSSRLTDLSTMVVANITGKVPFSNVTGANLSTITSGTGNNVTYTQLYLYGNVTSNYYFGNASTLTSLTGAQTGTYSGASNTTQVTVGSNGYITSINSVPIVITSDQVSNLIPAVANLTAYTIRGPVSFSQVTGANLQTVTNGFQNNVTTNQLDLQRGLLVSNDGASIALDVTGNVSSGYYFGNASSLISLTGASGGTYGSQSHVSQVFVTSSGYISNVIDVPIVISSSQVSDLSNAVVKNITGKVPFSNVTGANLSTITSGTGNNVTYTQVYLYGNVTSNYYFGNASSLTSLTGAAGGTYGSQSQVPQFIVESDGYISGISNVQILITSDQVSNLVSAVANLTANTIKGSINFSQVTGANLQTVSFGFQNNVTTNQLDLQRGLLVSNANSSNIVLQVTGNVLATNYFGNAKYLTNTTDATPATYGNASAVSQVTIDSNGRLSNVSNVLISITQNQISGTIDFSKLSGVNLQNVTSSGGNVTTNQVQLNGGLTSGSNFTVSNAAANVIQVTGNITASGFLFGNAAYLTSVPISNLQQVTTVGNTTTNQVNVQGGLLVSNTGASNVVQVTGNVSAGNYYGNAKYLTNTTDVPDGSYGSAVGGALVQLPVFTVGSGRITSLNTVPVTNLTVTNLQFTTTGLNANTTNNHVQLNNGFTVADKMSVSNSATSTNVMTITGNAYVSGKLQVGASGNVVVDPSASNVLTVKNLSNNSATNNYLVWDRTTGAVGVNVGGNFGGSTFRESVTFSFQENSSSPGVYLPANASDTIVFFQNPFATITYIAITYCYDNTTLNATIGLYDVSSNAIASGKITGGAPLFTPLTIPTGTTIKTVLSKVFSATTTPALTPVAPASPDGRSVSIRLNIGGTNNNNNFRILSVFVGFASAT